MPPGPLGPLRPVAALGLVRAIGLVDAIGLVGALGFLGALGLVHALRLGHALGPVRALVDVALAHIAVAEIDAHAPAFLADAHRVEAEARSEVAERVAVARAQRRVAEADVVRAPGERGPDLDDEPGNVDRARRGARQRDPLGCARVLVLRLAARAVEITWNRRHSRGDPAESERGDRGEAPADLAHGSLSSGGRARRPISATVSAAHGGVLRAHRVRMACRRAVTAAEKTDAAQAPGSAARRRSTAL